MGKKTKKQTGPKRKHQSVTKVLIDNGTYTVEHGDYQRIANLCIKPDGSLYTADYVRKVLLGLRFCKLVDDKANKYFKKKTKLMSDLTMPTLEK